VSVSERLHVSVLSYTRCCLSLLSSDKESSLARSSLLAAQCLRRLDDYDTPTTRAQRGCERGAVHRGPDGFSDTGKVRSSRVVVTVGHTFSLVFAPLSSGVNAQAGGAPAQEPAWRGRSKYYQFRDSSADRTPCAFREGRCSLPCFALRYKRANECVSWHLYHTRPSREARQRALWALRRWSEDNDQLVGSVAPCNRRDLEMSPQLTVQHWLSRQLEQYVRSRRRARC
jgi:hypothetical protein